ncbi:hypothetical protein RFI36_03560 [Acinetobacter gerneri]|jgi:hypothetical protein|uniref:Uncharacterized protein n=1 Tax=Acinetobacter gerneri TaxID=202952 RepID=A0AAW8JI64_9GAMM|nr:hypothetical protein [Acinetobacter gerneri]MCH4244926.1 hypothetical protein [Acinetobacter gerneri]MDQ9008899.1 hypothetical protein [Acinetobacter gerneri]MDQ9013003.1 hypothetical protein [Acinetobacter gerneri]MDQ9024359.1 hypothetical protein [Acinetobacter gerneri]MDQ9051675.1 hypothetical protein [Acinetobacter gerneri]
MHSTSQFEPTTQERLEAKSLPHGWVYRLDGIYDEKTEVPSSAIIGAWEVDEKGEIIEKFILNPQYIFKSK